MGRKKRWMIGTLALQLIAFPLCRQAGAESLTLQNQLDARIQELQQDPDTKGMRVGVEVYDLNTHKELYSYNKRKTFVPASTKKLLVVAAALDQLGENYRFKTELYTDGKMTSSGVLQGNLILKGYGDPSFSIDDLNQMIQQLKQKGIKSIEGNILVDERYFDQKRLAPGWMWDDEVYGYSAQLSALALQENTIHMTVAPGAAEAPIVTMDPANHYVKIENEAKTIEGMDEDITFTRPRGQNVISINGFIGKHAKPADENVTMEDPALFVGNVMKNLLSKAGMKLSDHCKVSKQAYTPKSQVPAVVHQSQPLSVLIKHLGKASDNFYAEMLLKAIGAVKKGQGSFEAGLQVVSEFLNKAGIASGYQQVDGSGLSRLDLVSPELMVDLLRYVSTRPYYSAFADSLPVAGVDGTLKRRMAGTPAEKNMQAKTGSMSGVHSLAGYINTMNGDKLAFSINLNGVYKSSAASILEDKIGSLLAGEHEDKGAQPEQKSVNPSHYPLSPVLDPILNQSKLNGVTTGIIVKSADQGEVFYERDVDKLLTPASNTKLLTSAAALQALGKDYRFRTELYISAQPKNGILNGDIILKGYGDPTLHTEDSLKVQDGVSIEKMASSFKEKGIKQVNGNIIVDESYLDSERLGLGWTWDDESAYYNPELSALELNRGTVKLGFHPGAVGAPVPIQLSPQTSYVQIINQAKTVAAGQKKTFKIERKRGTNRIEISGNLPRHAGSDYERIPVQDPALYTGTVLKEKMVQTGIHLNAKSQVQMGIIPPNSIRLAEFKSLPLKDIIAYLNKKSDNAYAELITKTLGAVKRSQGSTESGIKVITNTLAAMGVDTHFDMVDGSGLSRYDQISARQVISVLEGMAKQPAFSSYYNSLPIAGKDGTLKMRLRQTAAVANMHAKTGSMKGVESLAGFVQTKDGEKLVLAILMNGLADKSTLESIQDQISAALAAYKRK
jgi:serine-type D-Ala-D-Ala carboxypeptidase/endopeptidase (penicillin-binding protein 4)